MKIYDISRRLDEETPVWPGAGVTTTLLLTPGTATPRTMFPEGTRVGFEEEAVRVTASPSLSATANGMASEAVPMRVIWLGMAAITGAPTVTLKLVEEEAVPSETVTVMTAEPCWALAGVTVIVQLV